MRECLQIYNIVIYYAKMWYTQYYTHQMRGTDVGNQLPNALAAARNRAETTLMRLPRPVESLTDEQLLDRIIKLLVGSTRTAYSVKTGKTTMLMLRDRRLNKWGIRLSAVGTVMSSVLLLVYLHEFWARQPQREIRAIVDHVFADHYDELLRAHAAESS